jgi:hypothetical protein
VDIKIGGTDRFSIASTGATTITVGGNEDTLTLKSTDADANVGPVINFTRDSSSPADNDFLGAIDFQGDNDAGETHDYVRILSRALDVSDGAEKADLAIKAADGNNYVNFAHTEVIFNEDSQDRDFRVESDGKTHMLHVDAGNNRVGMITEPDLGIGLHIRESDSGGSIDAWADALVIEGSADSGMTILSGNASDGSINWGDDGDNDAGRIVYNHNVNQLKFYNGGAERMAINTAGEVGIGLSSFDSQLVVSRATAGGSYSIFGIHSASSGVVRILRGSFSGQTPDDRTSVFITMGDATATRFNVHADGDVDNHDNFYGQISDERIKSNITDANSQWDDIKAIKFRNFERKDDIAQYGNGKKVQIGVVAQELETVSPGLVRETEPTADDIKMSSEFGTLYEDGDSIPEDKNIGDIKTTTGEKVKAVAYSVLYIKAAKALQEAMARIETLETKVKALEDA